MAILIGKKPSNPNELPSQAWARVTAETSDGGSTITAKEIQDLHALYRFIVRQTPSPLTRLSEQERAREEAFLAQIHQIPLTAEERIQEQFTRADVTMFSVGSVFSVGETVLNLAATAGFALSLWECIKELIVHPKKEEKK